MKLKCRRNSIITRAHRGTNARCRQGTSFFNLITVKTEIAIFAKHLEEDRNRIA